MIANVHSATNVGFEGKLIEVECDASAGLPVLTLVGLGNKAVDEAKERVRSAIKNSGFEFPRKRVTVNLAPANLPKDGAHFDLAIALGLLCISGQLAQDVLEDLLVVGELGLDGSLRPIRGVIGHIETAASSGIRRVAIPSKNYAQAVLVGGADIISVQSLRELVDHLRDNKRVTDLPHITDIEKSRLTTTSLSDIRGQEQAKRALMIAAAGNHNILFDGPPGAGKTMLAKALSGLLPPLTAQEIIAVTKLHSLAGEIDEQIVLERPFRSPHHSASHISLIGGGIHPRPGEVSLAHGGVLFLDELPEYSRASLEALRQPLEDKEVHIARTHSRVTYPADFMLVATQNPCPCGFANDQTNVCTCSATALEHYRKKVSGPLMDRIDLYVQVSKVEVDKLLDQTRPNVNCYQLVQEARQRQIDRTPHKTNATLSNEEIKQLANLDTESRSLLNTAAEKLNLSARSYFKVLKVARTIADIDAAASIKLAHISEALQYRRR